MLNINSINLKYSYGYHEPVGLIILIWLSVERLKNE